MISTLLRWWKGIWSNRRGIKEQGLPMLSGVDVAIRQERLNDGLNRVFEVDGIDSRVNLPEKNTTRGKKPYTEYYSWPTCLMAVTFLMAVTLLGSEIEAFGYSFEGLLDGKAVVFLDNELEL